MKDSIMETHEWRTAQIFLSIRGIFEVDVDIESQDIRCSCPGFETRKICKHTRFVIKKVTENDGTYPLKISSRATASETKSAQESYESFRDFAVKYGKIEIL
jgi:hypothetical protein